MISVISKLKYSFEKGQLWKIYSILVQAISQLKRDIIFIQSNNGYQTQNIQSIILIKRVSFKGHQFTTVRIGRRKISPELLPLLI